MRNATTGKTAIASLGWALWALAGMTLFAGTGTEQGHTCCKVEQQENSATTTPGRELTVPDVPVVDQDGRERRFYSDLVAGKVVALNFVFTTCRTICPPLGVSFGKLRRELRERGLDVQLISISVDPVTDTPARLKAWSKQFDAGPGWTLVTGAKRDIDQLLKAVNAFTADKWEHAPIVLLGNEANGQWTRTFGLASPESLADLLHKMAGGGEAQLVERGSP